MNNVVRRRATERQRLAQQGRLMSLICSPMICPRAQSFIFVVATRGSPTGLVGRVRGAQRISFSIPGAVSIGDEFAYTGLPTDGVHALGRSRPGPDRRGSVGQLFEGTTYVWSATPRPNFSFGVFGGMHRPDPGGWESPWNIKRRCGFFATWATYDEDDMCGLYERSSINLGLDFSPNNTYEGAMYRMVGPAFGADRFDPSRFVATRRRRREAFISIPRNGLFSRLPPENGLDTQYRASLMRSSQIPAAAAPAILMPVAVPNYQGMWWNPADQDGII